MPPYETIWPWLLPFELEKIICEFVGNNVSPTQKKLHKYLLRTFKSIIAIQEISYAHWFPTKKQFLIPRTINTKYPQSILKSKKNILKARSKNILYGSGFVIKNTKKDRRMAETWALINPKYPENWKFAMSNPDVAQDKTLIHWHHHWDYRCEEITYLRNKYDNSQLETLFSYLKKCSCCNSHQYNTPKHITDEWDEQSIYRPRYGEKMSCEYRCKCPCRHYKRIIAEAYQLS